MKTEDYQKVEIASLSDLHHWLQKNHEQTDSVWLVTYKKSNLQKYVARWDIVDELLCFGWVDGILRALDEERTMHFVSPRKTQHWTKMYKDRFEKLLNADRIAPAGAQAVTASKKSGLWDLMDDVDNLTVPEDLTHALQQAKALPGFEKLNHSYKRNLLRHIKLAKTEATRNQRIQKIVDYTARGERIRNM